MKKLLNKSTKAKKLLSTNKKTLYSNSKKLQNANLTDKIQCCSEDSTLYAGNIYVQSFQENGLEILSVSLKDTPLSLNIMIVDENGDLHAGNIIMKSGCVMSSYYGDVYSYINGNLLGKNPEGYSVVGNVDGSIGGRINGNVVGNGDPRIAIGGYISGDIMNGVVGNIYENKDTTYGVVGKVQSLCGIVFPSDEEAEKEKTLRNYEAIAMYGSVSGRISCYDEQNHVPLGLSIYGYGPIAVKGNIEGGNFIGGLYGTMSDETIGGTVIGTIEHGIIGDLGPYLSSEEKLFPEYNNYAILGGIVGNINEIISGSIMNTVYSSWAINGNINGGIIGDISGMTLGDDKTEKTGYTISGNIYPGTLGCISGDIKGKIKGAVYVDTDSSEFTVNSNPVNALMCIKNTNGTNYYLHGSGHEPEIYKYEDTNKFGEGSLFFSQEVNGPRAVVSVYFDSHECNTIAIKNVTMITRNGIAENSVIMKVFNATTSTLLGTSNPNAAATANSLVTFTFDEPVEFASNIECLRLLFYDPANPDNMKYMTGGCNAYKYEKSQNYGVYTKNATATAACPDHNVIKAIEYYCYNK